jgi:hypothetical protein
MADHCTPLSFRIALKRNATQKIEFGLTKSCKKVAEKFEAVWIIHFALLEKDGNAFTPKISVDIDINNDAPGKQEQAEQTEQNGLSENQTLYLLGPVSRAADRAIQQPFDQQIRDLFATAAGDPGRFRQEQEADPLEVLDLAAVERGDNIRKLKTRVISVLDVQ